MIRRHEIPSTLAAALLGLVLAACGGETAAPSARAPERPSALAYSQNPALYTVGVAIAPNTPTYEGGAPGSYAVWPPLPEGLALDPASGVIAGTPLATAEAARYTVRASSAGGETSTTLFVTVQDAPPERLTYATSAAIYIRGVAIPPNVPAIAGGAPSSFSVRPSLPAGLRLDATTGVISGTPAEVAGAASYGVRAANAGGSTAATLTITVNEAPPAGLSYAASPAVYTVGVPIEDNQPTSTGGRVDTYEVTPALPAGLVLDAGTGAIAGTPSAIAAAAAYEIRASNEAGSTATLLTITVNDVPPRDLAYTSPESLYAMGVAVAPNHPASSGGAVTSYTVSPELPEGLVLDASTGVLGGTPREFSPATSYVVTASNSGGSATTLLTITVSTMADASQAVVAGSLATLTPFARRLVVRGTRLDAVRSATFTIAPQADTYSRPVSATYRRGYMQRQGFLVSDQELRLLVFGLYAGVNNPVEVTLHFSDESVRTISTIVAAERYDESPRLYTAPTIKASRRAGDGLNFDYFMMKSGLGSPVVMDSDGKVRWVAPGTVEEAMSSVPGPDGFIVGTGSVDLTHVGFDGSVNTVNIDEDRYRNFHHDLTWGKAGLLAMVDGYSVSGDLRVETMLVELSPQGEVLKEWDFQDIVAEVMKDGGDDPGGLIRQGFDWFHINSAEYVPEDDSLLISSREHFVMKIDYDTSEIKWLFGDPTKHWYSFPSLRRLALTLSTGLYPIGQHSLSWPASGELLLFNNGYASLTNPPGTPAGEDRAYSAGCRYLVDEENRTAEEIWTYDANQRIRSTIGSSIYEAAPEQYLVTYSFYQSKAKLVGLLPGGQVAFDFEFPSNLSKTAWNARPIAFERMDFVQ